LVWLYVITGWTVASVASALPLARTLRFHDVVRREFSMTGAIAA
jgi:hypothetical protein